MLLSGQPYKPLGAPASIVRADNSSVNRDRGSNQVCPFNLLHFSEAYADQAPAVEKTPELLTLALNSLGTFDFSGRFILIAVVVSHDSPFRTCFERVCAELRIALPRGRVT